MIVVAFLFFKIPKWFVALIFRSEFAQSAYRWSAFFGFFLVGVFLLFGGILEFFRPGSWR